MCPDGTAVGLRPEVGQPSLETSAANLTFVHIPRTGGVWVTEALKNQGVPLVDHGHVPLPEFTPRSFTVVRQRDSWLKSWYAMLDSRNMAPDRRSNVTPLCLPLLNLDYSSFESFCVSYDKECPSFYEDMNAKMICGCEQVLHQETLTEELIALLNQWNVEFDADRMRSFSRRNVSKTSV
jgi:hypothetical protein